MEIRKYLFLITQRGIKTYKYNGAMDFQLIKYRGEEAYPGNNLSDFMVWFEKMASIAKDEDIDFCFLSDEPVEIDSTAYRMQENSTWTKVDVQQFIEGEVGLTTFKVKIDQVSSFVCQNGNVFDKENVKSMFLKCYPSFSDNVLEESSDEKQKINPLYDYYKRKLKELE